mgnify:CR=1 FL=1
MSAYAVKHLAHDHGPLATTMKDVRRAPFSFTSHEPEASEAAQGNDVYVFEVRGEARGPRSYWLGYKYRAYEKYPPAGNGLWRERFKKIGIGAAALVLIGAYFVYEDYDARVENVRVPATVTNVGPLNIKNTRLIEEGLAVEVALDSGRRVNVMAMKTTDPHVGDHIEITEHRHHTGRVTYSWK